MKNFKLLLATTAMLSMGAMAASATDPVTTPVGTLTGESATVEVNAELIKAYSLSATPLSFGRVVFSSSSEDPMTTVSVYIDENGLTAIDETYSPNNSQSAYVLTQGTRGYVTGATCAQLIYPASDNQPNGDTNIPLTKPSGAASTLHAAVDELHCSDVDSKSAFWGRLYIYDSAAGEIPAGTYSGSFTVTVIPTIYGSGD